MTNLSEDILNVLNDTQSEVTDDHLWNDDFSDDETQEGNQEQEREREEEQEKRQEQQQQQELNKKKEQLHLDGKLYLLQGQVEKATTQLKQSQKHSVELENVIKLQTIELEKKHSEILHFKTSQRETDGQLMLLKYRLDKSQSTQQRLQLLTNGESHETSHKESLIAIPSSEVIVASEVEVDRFSFLSHVRKLSSSLQQIRKRIQSNQIPLEEIDGIASSDPSPSQKKIDPKFTRGGGQDSGLLDQTRSNTISESQGFLPKEVEVLSEFKSDYRQDEFSEYIRSKLGLGRTEVFSSLSVERKPEQVLKQETVNAPSKLPKRSDVPTQEFSHTQHKERSAHGTSISHSSFLQPQSQSSSRRGSFNRRSQFQVESQLIHEEVQRFRNFMHEMRVDCALTPSSTSSSLPQQHRPHPQFSHTTPTSFKPSGPLSSVPPSRGNTIPSAGSASYKWKSSLNAVGFEDESLLDPRAKGTDLNFSHLGKISTSPPPSHYSNPPPEVSPFTFNFTS